MAILESQKVDYLWKKLGYGRTKTDVNANKKAFNESIPSPLLLRGDKIWANQIDSATIPAQHHREELLLYIQIQLKLLLILLLHQLCMENKYN